MSTAARGWAAVWGWRLLLAAVLLVFTEFLWQGAGGAARDAAAWLMLAVIYVALGAVLIDLLARFRVGDLPGVLPVAGIYGLLYGILITPQTAFARMPISLVTRPLGLYTLGSGCLALVLLYWLVDGRGFARWRAAALLVLGLSWGVWARRFPQLSGGSAPPLDTLLLQALIGMIVIGVLLRLAGRGTVQDASALRLRRWEWPFVGGVLAAAFLAGPSRGVLSTEANAALGALLGYLIGVLYFQRGLWSRPLLSRLLPPQPVTLQTYTLYTAALVLPAALGYLLPGGGPADVAMQALTAIFTAFGVVWLPGTSLALGLRAYVRLYRRAR